MCFLVRLSPLLPGETLFNVHFCASVDCTLYDRCQLISLVSTCHFCLPSVFYLLLFILSTSLSPFLSLPLTHFSSLSPPLSFSNSSSHYPNFNCTPTLLSAPSVPSSFIWMFPYVRSQLRELHAGWFRGESTPGFSHVLLRHIKTIRWIPYC